MTIVVDFVLLAVIMSMVHRTIQWAKSLMTTLVDFVLLLNFHLFAL